MDQKHTMHSAFITTYNIMYFWMLYITEVFTEKKYYYSGEKKDREREKK